MTNKVVFFDARSGARISSPVSAPPAAKASQTTCHSARANVARAGLFCSWHRAPQSTRLECRWAAGAPVEEGVSRRKHAA